MKLDRRLSGPGKGRPPRAPPSRDAYRATLSIVRRRASGPAPGDPLAAYRGALGRTLDPRQKASARHRPLSQPFILRRLRDRPSHEPRRCFSYERVRWRGGGAGGGMDSLPRGWASKPIASAPRGNGRSAHFPARAYFGFWPYERLFGPSWWYNCFLKGSIPRSPLLSRASGGWHVQLCRLSRAPGVPLLGPALPGGASASSRAACSVASRAFSASAAALRSAMRFPRAATAVIARAARRSEFGPGCARVLQSYLRLAAAAVCCRSVTLVVATYSSYGAGAPYQLSPVLCLSQNWHAIEMSC